MPRRRLTLALAWLPCVLCAALWPASYRWEAGMNAVGYVLDVVDGGFYATPTPAGMTYHRWAWVDPAQVGPYAIEESANVPDDRRLPFRIIEIDVGATRPRVTRVAVVPLWVPTLALGVPPLWLTRRAADPP